MWSALEEKSEIRHRHSMHLFWQSVLSMLLMLSEIRKKIRGSMETRIFLMTIIFPIASLPSRKLNSSMKLHFQGMQWQDCCHPCNHSQGVRFNKFFLSSRCPRPWSNFSVLISCLLRTKGWRLGLQDYAESKRKTRAFLRKIYHKLLNAMVPENCFF